MYVYYALILVSVLACAGCAGAIVANPDARRDGSARTLAFLGFAFWGACQLLYHLQADPHAALAIARASAPGWVFLGPLCLRAFQRHGQVDRPGLRPLAQALTALSALWMGLAFATPWVIAGVQPTAWGYAVVPGPLFLATCATNGVGAGVGLVLARHAPARLSPVERRRRYLITGAVAVPVAVMSVTDVALPLLGFAVSPTAPAVFGPLAIVALWLRVRIGYSSLTPVHVANEILEILPDGVALLNPDGRIRLANKGLARMCGIAAARLEGVPMAELLRSSDDEPNRGTLHAFSGPPMPVALDSVDLADEVGEQVGRVLVVRDLREVADLRNRLVVSGRLAAVGELAAGIAHEINNPLAFVRSNLSQLEGLWKRLRPDADELEPAMRAELVKDGAELIEESTEGVDRAVEIVRGVKSFAHAGSDDRVLTDLEPLLDDVLRVASSQLRNRVTVQREYHEDLPPVLCAPQQLRQVFLNLVINAAQAVEDGGHVLVATRRDGEHVIVSVADDGCGIAPEILDRIFDPFFTTKSVGVGTGLGLGIAHQIVSSHGGEIRVESAPGVGSVFRVRLPAASRDA